MEEVPEAGRDRVGSSKGVATDPQRTIPLLDAMVDVALVYGFDETCSRELGVMMDEQDFDHSVDVLISEHALKIHFLQIITPGQSYPQRSTGSGEEGEGDGLDGTPNRRSNGAQEGGGGPGGTSPLSVGGHKKKFNMEDFGLTWDSIQAMHFFLFPEGKGPGSMSASSSTSELPSPLLIMCNSSSNSSNYEGPRIYTNSEETPASIIHLLFTDILGERSFRSVLRFSRPFFITRHAESQYFSLIPWSSEITPPQGCRYRLVYLPTSLVLVSKRPCFQFMKDVLSGFHSYFVEQGDDRDFWDLTKTFTERIFLIPCPPPGTLSVEFELLGFTSNLVVRPPRVGLWAGTTSNSSLTFPHPEQYLDIRLTYPFLCLSEDNVLLVVSALLTEQTVLFVSSLYPMLMYVIQCFLSYVYPFVWRHSIVPLLPYALLEVLDAPVATILGVHSSFTSEPEFRRVENAVIVDLDNNTVKVLLDNPLPSLPKAAVDIFKTKYSLLMKQYYEVHSMQKLSPTSVTKQQREREEFDSFLDDSLAKMFLELMVRLYSKVIKHLLRSRHHYEETVKAMDPEEQNFYRQTEATDMFSAFYQRLKQGAPMDDFNLLAVRLEREERRQQGHDVEESVFQSTTSTRARGSVISLNTSSVTSWYTMTRKYLKNDKGSKDRRKHLTDTSDPSSFEDDTSLSRVSPLSAMGASTGGLAPSSDPLTLVLPSLGSEFKGRGQFLDEVIASLDEMEDNPAVQAQCIYLRGFYLLCKRDVVRALEDIYDNLQRLEVALVPDPKNFLVLPRFLSAGERAELTEHPHYNHICAFQKKAVTKRTGTVDLGKTMPKKSMNYNDFLKLVHQNSIATDAESASNLHKILALERATVVSPEVFKTFYEAWKGVLHENQSVELPNVTLGKPEKGQCIAEQVLAVAHPVRTNYSSQTTLVITTYRLLAVASFDTHVMAEFSTPLRFEYFSYAPSIIAAKLPGIRVEFTAKSKLRVDKKKSQDVFMAFEDHYDRENWYHLLVEMVAGYSLSQRLKDPGVMETAQGHVLLQNAINQSGILEKCMHVRRTKRAMKLLSFQAKDASEVSPITVEALQYRINPSRHESEKQTVESLLYIPPNVEEEGGCGQGKLWIGLGNGRLKVYDIESKCFESDIKITESKHGRSVRLSCLLLVNQHVWVGSHSKNIHILDAESVCHVSQLPYLEDAPRDMELSEDRRVVWTLLLNGILLSWDPATRKRISKKENLTTIGQREPKVHESHWYTMRIQVPFSENTQYITCTCFAIWKNYIWVGTNRGSISVMDTDQGSRVKEIFFPGGSKRQIEIKHLAVSSEGEIWCSVYSIPRGEDSTFVAAFNPSNYEKVMHFNKLDNRVSVILPVNDSMWCGTKSGKIYIFHSRTYAKGKNMPKVLSAHEDFIRTMTLTDINLVVSGSGSNDGYAAVWKTIDLPDARNL